MKKTLVFCVMLMVFMVACSGQAFPLPTSTSTAKPSTLTPTLTLTPSPTPIPSATPIPTMFVTLGSPFDEACGIPLLINDNSFNGVQGKFDGNHGHFDLWTSDCNPNTFDGEVLAPVSGIIEKHPNSYRIVLPQNTYLENIEFALFFVGIKNPELFMVKGLAIDLGHLELIDGLMPGDYIEKGSPIGNLVESHYPSPKLAYHINFWYGKNAIIGHYDEHFYMASPTLFKNDVTYPMNFSVPNEPVYQQIYPDNQSPWLCDFRAKSIINDWKPYYCYPEPMAYP